MDDTSSVDSFEDIVQSSPDGARGVTHFSSARDDALARFLASQPTSVDFSDNDVPDVCYVLRYREFGKGLVEVRRSSKPIDINLGQVLDEKSPPGGKKKPVLEIVTEVFTSRMRSRRDYKGHHQSDRYSSSRRDEWHGGTRRGENPDVRVTDAENTVMVIHSPHLINAITAVIDYYPNVSFTGSEIEIDAPYRVLVHHRAALMRYRDHQPETHSEAYAFTTAEHIDVLLGFLEKTYGQQLHEEEARHNRAIPTATFNYFWLLLKPGEVIYTRYDNAWTPFVISSLYKTTTANPDGVYGYSIDCWNYMYSDGRLRRRMHTFDVQPFSGEEAIHNLPVIPARFFNGAEKNMSPADAAAEQVRLGKLAWDLYEGPSYKSYEGELARKSPYASRDYSVCPTGYMNGRVVIDGEGYERYGRACPTRSHTLPLPPRPPHQPTPFDQLPYFAAHCGCSACGSSDRANSLSPFAMFQDLDPKQDKAPENDLYFLVVSKVVAGFLLGERRWGHFHVESLRDIKFDKEAFNYLVLDDDIKTTVKALVRKFASIDGHVSAWPNDFIKNKGQGRIFLLHGSPGVGKTCTAESVAELTRRPLLSLTSGDLSTNSSQVERNLEYFLALGERFGAVVLLDEADVYLESRRARDIARNGLVSVFLRALEYYRGMLILTTNRVQTFDAAFTSRIHVTLHYGPLTDAHRERIWMNGFERLERDSGGRVHVTVAAKQYAWGSERVRLLRWNGREIRNALQTAVALAESEALDEGGDVVVVTEKHIRSIARMSRGFKDFMWRRRLQTDEADGLCDDDDDRVDHEENDDTSMDENKSVGYSESDTSVSPGRYV